MSPCVARNCGWGVDESRQTLIGISLGTGLDGAGGWVMAVGAFVTHAITARHEAERRTTFLHAFMKDCRPSMNLPN